MYTLIKRTENRLQSEVWVPNLVWYISTKLYFLLNSLGYYHSICFSSTGRWAMRTLEACLCIVGRVQVSTFQFLSQSLGLSPGLTLFHCRSGAWDSLHGWIWLTFLSHMPEAILYLVFVWHVCYNRAQYFQAPLVQKGIIPGLLLEFITFYGDCTWLDNEYPQVCKDFLKILKR